MLWGSQNVGDVVDEQIWTSGFGRGGQVLGGGRWETGADVQTDIYGAALK